MGYLDDKLEEIEALCGRYEWRRSAILPVLWMVQRKLGWVPQDAMKEVAEILGLTAAEVYEVVSFYTMFHQKPVGKKHIALCKTLSCAITGAFEASEYIQKKYNVPLNGVSDDGQYSLEHVECIGACNIAPAFILGEDLHGNLTPDKIDQLLTN